VERRDVTDDLMVIKLVPDDGVFDFKPGQYCTLGKEGVGRAYSTESAPNQDFLEVFVELVPDGELSPKTWRLNIGDTMSVRPRGKGGFTFKENVTTI
jgi:ferredoxin--NADP+ reductase